MNSDDFTEFLEERGHHKAGLCMFAPAILASIANRLLNDAYGDTGDNLSVPMCAMAGGSQVRYLAGNYSSADLVAVKNSIDVLDKIPGAVILITASGVGAKTVETLGLLRNGQVEAFEESEHSFFSFAENYLSVKRCEEEVQPPSMGNIAQKVQQVENFIFGTEEEVSARGELLTVISELEALFAHQVAPQVYGGIGHNRPPREMIIPKDVTDSVGLNIYIIKSEIQSASPEPTKVVNSARTLQKTGEEISDFFQRTAEHLKSDGSRALAGAIISGVLWVVWRVVNWISIVLGFPIL